MLTHAVGTQGGTHRCPARALYAAALLSVAFPYLAYAVAPAAPTGPEVGAAVNADGGPSVANLWWNSNTESDLKSYQIYRTTSTSGVVVNSSWTVAIATMAVEGTTTVESGLTNETTYYYVIVAVNLGTELSAASVTVSTKPVAGAANPSPAAPSAPGTAAVATGGALNLSWTAPADIDLKDYRVFRATLPGAVTAKKLWTVVIVPGTTRQDAGLTNGTTYYYQLIARDTNLNGSPATLEFSAVPQDTLAPAVPTGLTSAPRNGAVNLLWSGNTEGDLKDYRVWRSTNAGVTLVASHTVVVVLAPGTTHRDAGLTNEATFYYRLTARDSSMNESGGAAEASGTPDGVLPTSGISAPQNGTRLSSLTTISGTSSDSPPGAVAQVEVSLRTGALYWNGAGWAPGETWVIATGTNPWVYASPAWADGLTYEIRSKATDVAGNVQSPVAVSTFTYDVSPPAAPASPGVSDSGIGAAINLTWLANTEGDLKDYRVWRSTNAGVTLVSSHAVVVIAPPGTTHQDAGVTNGTTYYYRITARDTAQPSLNESGGSSEVSRVAGVPSAPSGLGVGDVAVDEGVALRLSWTANTEADLKDYGVYRATWAGASPAPTPTRIVTPGTTHQDAGLTPVTTYYFRLTARDTILNESGFSTEVNLRPVDNSSPTAPGAPAAADVPSDQGFALRLNWTLNTETDVREYRLYRSTNAGVTAVSSHVAVTIASPGTTHQDGGLTNGTTFYYRLAARDASANESPLSPEANAIPSDNTAPATPAGLGLSNTAGGANAGERMSLSWTSSTEADLKEYRVYRSTNSGVTQVSSHVVAAVAAPGTTHQDAGLTNLATFYYRLSARDVSLNESGLGTELGTYPADVVAPASPATLGAANPALGQKLNLSWAADTESDLKDYRLYRGTSAGGQEAAPTRVILAPGTTHQDAGLANGTTYYFRVKARDTALNESAGSPEASAYPTDLVPPSAPLGIGAADQPGDQGFALRLSWFANTEGDLKDYLLYRSTFGSLLAQKIQVTILLPPGTTHLDGGLSLGATYYFQMTARDTSLNASGGSAEVAAYPVDNLAPAAPVGLSGVDTPGDQGFGVSISWAGNTESDLKDYGIYRATFAGLLGTKTLKVRVTTPGTTHQDASLTNGTTYYYQVTARDATGNESGAGADFSVIPADNLAPAAPGGLSVGDPGTTVLNLSWTADTEPDLKDYRVWRATYSPVGIGGAFSPAATIASPGTTHQDAGLTVGTRYNYRLTARDVSTNESGGSSEVSGVPGAPAVPAAPGIADVPADGGTALNLSWTANPEADMKDYGVYRATFALASPAPTPTRIATPGTTHQAAGLAGGSTYYFRLTARDSSSNESGYSTEASAYPVDNIPAVPTGLGVADAPVDQGFALRLSWSVNPDTDMKDYGVYRATTAGGVDAAPTRITNPGTTHQAGGLTNGTTYYFRLTARDLGPNESGYSTEVSAIPYDNLAPAAPVGVGVVDVPSDQGFALRISWTANTEADRKDYGVYRATWAGASPAPTPARIAAPGTTSQDGGLTNGTTYYFRLTARDVSLNESGYSTEVSAIPYDNLAPGMPAGLGVADAGVDQGERLNVSWTANTEADRKDYRVYRATWAGASPAPTPTTTIATPGTTHQDTGLNAATTYYYRLTARDVSLNESGPTSDAALKPTDEIPPAAPGPGGTFLVLNQGEGRRLRLSWAANTEPDLKDYRIYRSTSAGVTLVSSLVVTGVAAPGTTHQDGGLTDGTTYYYRLTARDLGLNESAAFGDVNAFPTDTTAPGAPAGLAASNTLGGASAGGRLSLTWTATTETDLKDYGVYQATWAGAGPAPTPTRILQPGTTHQAGGLTNGTTYYVRLTTRDLTLNESGFSSEVPGYPADIVPPAAPSLNFVNNTGTSGSLKLGWVANTEADIGSYRIYGATVSGALIAKTLWAVVSSPATSYLALGLTVGTTYYWQMTARDGTGNESLESAELSRVAGPDAIAPGIIGNLAAVPGAVDGYVRLTWTALGDDGTEGTAVGYQVWHANFPILSEVDLTVASVLPQSWVPQTSGAAEDRTVGPFVSGTTYYFAVKAYDDVGNGGSLSNVVGNSAPAQNLPPAAPAVAPKNLNWGVRLLLTPPGDPDLLRYIIFSSVFQGGPYVQIATSPASSAVFENVLTTIETRYYVVRLEDKTGYQSANSGEVSGKPEANLPFSPTDVNATLGDAGTVLSWRPPVRYLNGTPYVEKSGYRIERAAMLTSPWLTAAEAAADATSWTDTTAGNFFYRVRALTGPKVPGPPSLVVSNQPGGATMALGTDEQGRVAAVLEIGRDAADDLRAAANGRGQDVFIEVIRKPDLRTADVVEAFDFQPSLAGTGEKLARFRFRRPVTMRFYYQMEGGQISRLGVPADQAAGALAVYTHNGIDWVNLGGEVDTDRREVKAKTSSLSLYRLARAARATEFRLVQVVPPRVFTPNGDGVWDVVEFFYENPAGATVTGKILDAKGAQVADLKIGGRGTSLVWDGLHADGRQAAGGVYLYQVEFDGKVIHGAIVLAR